MAIILTLIHEADGVFGASFPDYPTVVAGGASAEEALARSRDALGAHFEAMIAEGIPIAAPGQVVLAEIAPDVVGIAHVEVDIPSKAQRVNVTIDEDLLASIDRAARAVGETRSAFLARAARERLAG